MVDALVTPARQCAAVSTILGAMTAPGQYPLEVAMATTPGTEPTAPPAMSLCTLVVPCTDAGDEAAWARDAGTSKAAARRLSARIRFIHCSVRHRPDFFVRRSG